MAAQAVAAADAVLVRAVADQVKVNRAAFREAIPGGMAEPTRTSHLGAIAISHPAMMATSSRAMMRNPPTTRRATSAHARRKSAIAQAAAAAVMEAAAAAWAVNAAKRLAHPPKAVSQTRCAPALT